MRLSAHASVPFVASTAHGPFEDASLIVPGADPAVGRNVAQVCWDHVPLERMHPTLAPAAVYTWIVPLSSVAVGVGALEVEVGVGRGAPLGQ